MVRSAVRDGYQNDVLEEISVLYGGFQFWLADPHFPVCVGSGPCELFSVIMYNV